MKKLGIAAASALLVLGMAGPVSAVESRVIGYCAIANRSTFTTGVVHRATCVRFVTVRYIGTR